MRALYCSMVSNTMARPRCLISCGEAADGLRTAPSGARLPRSTAMPPLAASGLSIGRMTSVFQLRRVAAVLPDRLAVDRHRVAVEQAGLAERADHRRQASRVVEVLHQEAARRLEIDQRRHVAAVFVPVVQRQRHADAAGDGEQMDHGVGRPADGAVDANGVLERGARQDLRDPDVLPDQRRRCGGRRGGQARGGGNRRRAAPRCRAGQAPATPPSTPSSTPCP